MTSAIAALDTAAGQILLYGGGAGLVLIGLGFALRWAFREKHPHHPEHVRRPEEVRYVTDSGEFRLVHGTHRAMDKDGPTTVMPRGFAIRVAPGPRSWSEDLAAYKLQERARMGLVTPRDDDFLRHGGA